MRRDLTCLVYDHLCTKAEWLTLIIPRNIEDNHWMVVFGIQRPEFGYPNIYEREWEWWASCSLGSP